jgi:hypothetical protein
LIKKQQAENKASTEDTNYDSDSSQRTNKTIGKNNKGYTSSQNYVLIPPAFTALFVNYGFALSVRSVCDKLEALYDALAKDPNMKAIQLRRTSDLFRWIITWYGLAEFDVLYRMKWTPASKQDHIAHISE